MNLWPAALRRPTTEQHWRNVIADEIISEAKGYAELGPSARHVEAVLYEAAKLVRDPRANS